MNKRTILSLLVSGALLGLLQIGSSFETPGPPVAPAPTAPSLPGLPAHPPTRGGEDVIDWILSLDQYPYGTSVPVDVNQLVADGLAQLPDEGGQPNAGARSGKASSVWELVGPSGSPIATGTQRHSGRVLDLEWRPEGIRVGAANGGLWEFFLVFPVPLSDAVPSLPIGSFATHPQALDEIVIGTGEPGKISGLGAWYTLDGGATWGQSLMLPAMPKAFYRLRYAPDDANVIHAATTEGFYRSDDGGFIWNRKRFGDCTAVALDPTVSGLVYAGFQKEGLFMSPDSGDSWSKLTGTALPDTNIGRISLSLCNSSPQTLYALISLDDPDRLQWVLRSDDGGATWNALALPVNFDTGQGDYNNVIAVSPVDPDVVLLGGIQLWQSEDGGVNWAVAKDYHPDQHAVVWHPEGDQVWSGSDGGLYYSSDKGKTWSSAGNNLPITQFHNIAVCPQSPEIVYGGTQDNGLIGTTDLVNWDVVYTGDGAGVALKPGLCNVSWGVIGAFTTGSKFRRNRSVDSFATLTTVENGIETTAAWNPVIRIPYNSNTIYTGAQGFVYRSFDLGDNWEKITTWSFPGTVNELTASPGVDYAVYISLDLVDRGFRIWRYRSEVLTSLDSTQLPLTGYLRKVSPHAKVPGTAYLVVSDLITGTPGNRLFRTVDYGDNWTDISTTLPPVFALDAIAHPDNVNEIYLATTTGMLMSPDGGASWVRWNAGMPAANRIRELVCVEADTGIPGEYYLYAGSYGRSIWRRLLAAAEPSDTPEAPLGERAVLWPNVPNPFNPSTAIRFDLPQEGQVSLRVLDLAGRLIAGLVDRETLPAGRHEYFWEGKDDGGRQVAAGVYFYRLDFDTFSVTKRMVLVK